MKRRLRSRLRSAFFGQSDIFERFFNITDEVIENVYEQLFLLKYYGNWSFQEAYNLPIRLRKWFLMRTSKQREDEEEARKPKKH